MYVLFDESMANEGAFGGVAKTEVAERVRGISGTVLGAVSTSGLRYFAQTYIFDGFMVTAFVSTLDSCWQIAARSRREVNLDAMQVASRSQM